MLKYIFKRILLMVPILLVTSFIIFSGMHLASGDYVSTIEADQMTKEDYEELRESYGLNESLPKQFLKYIYNLVFKGDLGTSYSMHQPVMKIWKQRIGATMYLGLCATLVSWIIAIPLGILAAKHPGSLIDNTCNFLAAIGVATPNFWLGLMLIILFAVKLHWLPSYGNDYWYSVILPAITIGTGNTANLMRITRSSLVENSHMDYCRTARSKGVSEKVVFNKHAMINALIPIVHDSVGLLGLCVAGAALTESVFSWTGIGKLIIEAVQVRDTPLACGLLTMKCAIISVLALIEDLIYVMIDPRVKSMYVTARRAKKRA